MMVDEALARLNALKNVVSSGLANLMATLGWSAYR